MPWEHVGECGSGTLPGDAEWIDFGHDMAVRYLTMALGDPPAGCELGVMWHDHDLGSYPSVGVFWDCPADDAPWEYVNRAEELLDRFNDAVDWGSLYPLPSYEDESEEEDPPSSDEAEADFENPSPLRLTYYTYKGERFRCKHCAWQGLGSDLVQGEMFDELFELDCPSCHEKVTFVMYPTLADARANWDRLTDDERGEIELLERERARFDELCLKTPDQLPDISEHEFSLTWDFADGMTLLRQGNHVIFSEPAVYEGYARFEEVAQILKQRYGAALRDLVPSPSSELYLYGDSLSSSGRIEKCRQTIFSDREK